MMKIKTICSGILLSGLLWAFAACSDDEGQQPDGSMVFRVATKAGTTTPRLTRLYLAERLPEHANKPGEDVEGLHCELANRHAFEGDTWEATGLYGQWYKFAFINVPNLDGMGITMLPDPDKEHQTDPAYWYECDFNKLYMDFSPVIQYQEAHGPQTLSGGEDLAIYRKNIDRWVNPVNPTTEDVTLTRITGELVVDMGIPADQFEHPVQSVEIALTNIAYRAFLRDGAADSVWTVKKEHTHQFTWNIENNIATQNHRQVFQLALLPDTLAGATVTVHFYPVLNSDGEEVEQPEALVFPLQSDEEQPVYIKKNVRTRVLFNGLHTNEFEVRYAGFDDHAFIDVENDYWGGPNYDTDKDKEGNEGEEEGGYENEG